VTPPLDLLRPGRSIVGMSAILLPHRSSAEVDWEAFEAHVTRTAEVGLTPAVNMDTGFVHLLSAEQRAEVLSRTRSLGVEFVAGAFDEADVEAVQALGGTPVLFPSEHTADVVPAYERVAQSADRFIGFELSPVFHPDGRIWDLETYRAVLDLPQCIGAKHSSLERQPEWDRLRLRDEVRPEFLVLTGNDLAIDMVMYGSDYLLGLSTFAPAEFAARDQAWAVGDVDGFHRRNDVLQWLGATAFRPPVPAYRHDAALVFQLRGWAESDSTPEGAPRRSAWERDLLVSILRALEAAA
jgi:dihydrodipicolinate synthase/N-acetylneuraminate lyase